MIEPITSTEISSLSWLLPVSPADIPTPALEQALATTLLTNQFAYVYDHVAQSLEFISAGIAPMLGEVLPADGLTPAWFAARLHPDDAAPVTQAQALVGAYLYERGQAQAPLPDFLFSLDYRLRHANGHYRRVLYQLMLLERAPGPGPVLRSLSLFTDLTQHKLTTEVRCHVNQPDFAAFAAARQPFAAGPGLTGREAQVLALVLEGLTSRQIAHRLHLRESTVKTHRRNLLRKTASHSFYGLLGQL
jgi:DNA-binding CsgD family transcriptional regulator